VRLDGFLSLFTAHCPLFTVFPVRLNPASIPAVTHLSTRGPNPDTVALWKNLPGRLVFSHGE
jgi:hypothetical protein